MTTTRRLGGRVRIVAPRRHGPEFSAQQTWSELSKNIKEIQNHNACNLSFEENHRFAYNMVLYRQGEMLYKGVKSLISENLEYLLREQVAPVFPSGASQESLQKSNEAEMLLKALKSIWDDHLGNMSKLGQILKYMDRVYTKAAEVPETWETGLTLFLEHIFRPPIKEHVITAILTQIEFEREGYTINRSAVKGCVDVFLTLQTSAGGPTVYKEDLEPALLKKSRSFYEAEGKRLLISCDAPEYLRRVENALQAEESRAHHYLSSQTALPLRQILQDCLLTAHLGNVISMENSGLDVMIDTDKIEDVARLFRLYSMVPTGMTCLKRALKDSISRRGRDINQSSLSVDWDEQDDAQGDNSNGKGKGKSKPAASGVQTLGLALKWVQDVLDLKDKFDIVWKSAFGSDRDLESALNEAFGSFVNVNSRCSEFISLFIDDHLRRGLKGKTDTEVDLVLDKTITVFRFLGEKDVFERYYKGHLAKRLLLKRSVSDDAERGMLAKLKVECGYQFTQKLEGMFNDMKVSIDTMNEFRNYLQKPGISKPCIELSVTVMTATFWPMTHSNSPCTIPQQMNKTCKQFEQFYLSRHSGRRLTWQYSLGNADVRVKFKQRKHDLNVSTFALVILLLFEDVKDDDFLSYKEIQELTAIDHTDLKRHLQSLACAKFKILKKHPPGRDVDTSDSFCFNSDFTSQLQKIKISTVSSKVETSSERRETRDRIDEERRHQTEACIVRVMKLRKHMTHNELVNEVTPLLAGRFQPNPLDIKKRIEGLIEREYLERCEDRKSYNYLA
ncbi:Cullin-domain-containing protein [Guyanagaster necrorhizus]|uniref:Cullin-domain-containing protein n=1 Tax=Guyanagaster necrorhizus TaxID=856835 RepID=A0A9P7W2S8_9AGAR|nr:Cullin-domain-containing protein [Guyanagaster necrorhizus MCA 3950]KAG7451148.1 Cullin-domain-containing protein [Guyanagaster necrorhizus MCA 3950]